jgi:hypothetical protein
MKYTPRESTVPNEHQLEQRAARYAELHPDGPPARTHRLIGLFRRALPEVLRSRHTHSETERDV